MSWEEVVDNEIKSEGWEAPSSKNVKRSESIDKVGFSKRCSVLEDNIGEDKGEEEKKALHIALMKRHKITFKTLWKV